MQIEEIKKTETSEIVTQEELDISLYVAIEEGDLKALDTAIESGADVDAKGCVSNKKEHCFFTSFSPLKSVYLKTTENRRFVTKSKRDKLIDIDTCFSLADSLIAAGADTNPLFCEVIGSDDKWTYYLLNKTKDFSGLLHKVVEKNDLSLLSSLLKKGVDVNEIFYGNSPLHKAVKKSNNLSMIKELLEAGASLTQKNRDNLTAYDIALINNNLETAVYLTRLLNYSSWDDSEHRVQVDISNQLFRLANLMEIYLYANRRN
jgi:ankyrin repeat protein